MVVGVHRDAGVDLTEIALTACALRVAFGPCQRGQQHSGQQGDEADDDQQFYQGKTVREFWGAQLPGLEFGALARRARRGCIPRISGELFAFDNHGVTAST